MRTPVLLWLLLAVALVTGGCASLEVEAGLKQPANPTATAEAHSARSGPSQSQSSTATTSPKAMLPTMPTATAAPVQKPRADPTAMAEDLLAFLQAAVAYLEGEDAQGQMESATSIGLRNLARGLSLNYLRRSEGEPEAWIGASPGRWAFLLWRQEGKILYQTWTRTPAKADFSSFLMNPVIALRLVDTGSSLEMGLIPANFGSTADAQFFLLRLRDGRWQQVWLPLPAARDSWASGGGKVDFVGQGIDAFRLTGPVPRDVPASRVFHEFGVYLKQQYESEWRRQGDAYTRVSGHIVPTPMTALANFIDGLQRGDKAGAALFAMDPQVVERAVGMKLDVQPAGNGWFGGLQMEAKGEVRIRFFDSERRQRGFNATLVKQEGEWLVQAVEQMPPVPDLRATTVPQSRGDK